MHFLRLPKVKEKTGLSRSTIYLAISRGTFPPPVSLGARSVGWIDADVDEWIQQRINSARSGNPVPNPNATHEAGF
jgi:prophage regulatory protein